MINREDMLELTRRMNASRTCFSRIAGAYMDREGYEDGSFNTHFLKLKESEKAEKLLLAKAIPFAKTNEQLVEYDFAEGGSRMKSVYPMLLTLLQKELKADDILSIFYEVFGEQYQAASDYSITFFYGSYDRIAKGSDGKRQDESEEIYSFLICSVARLGEDYSSTEPEFGFLFPAISEGYITREKIDIYWKDPKKKDPKLMQLITGQVK